MDGADMQFRVGGMCTWVDTQTHTARLPGQTLGDQSSGFIDTHQASTSKQACSGDSADINHGRDGVGRMPTSVLQGLAN